MKAAIHRLVQTARSTVAGLTRPSIEQEFIKTAPDPQHALDIFKGEWLSALPSPLTPCRAGDAAALRRSADQVGGRAVGRRPGAAGDRARPARRRPLLDARADGRGGSDRRRSEHARLPQMPDAEGADRHDPRPLPVRRFRRLPARESGAGGRDRGERDPLSHDQPGGADRRDRRAHRSDVPVDLLLRQGDRRRLPVLAARFGPARVRDARGILPTRSIRITTGPRASASDFRAASTATATG